MWQCLNFKIGYIHMHIFTKQLQELSGWDLFENHVVDFYISVIILCFPHQYVDIKVLGSPCKCGAHVTFVIWCCSFWFTWGKTWPGSALEPGPDQSNLELKLDKLKLASIWTGTFCLVQKQSFSIWERIPSVGFDQTGFKPELIWYSSTAGSELVTSWPPYLRGFVSLLFFDCCVGGMVGLASSRPVAAFSCDLLWAACLSWLLSIRSLCLYQFFCKIGIKRIGMFAKWKSWL